jgi:hypothetical protein
MQQPCAPGADQAATYRIRVEGQLSERWARHLGAMAIAEYSVHEGKPMTTLLGTVVDQAALRGILCQLWDLKLVLISVARVDSRQGDAHTPGGELAA